MNTTTTTESAGTCGQSANSADNLRTRPTPETDAFILGSITKTDWNWRHFARNLERERDAEKAEIQAMRAAIEEAETSLTDIAEYWNQDENESAMSDACWHAIGTAQKAIAKLKPFLTQES